MPAKTSCSAANAQAELGIAQMHHSKLLRRNNQNPQFRLSFLSAPTYQEAKMVIIMAGH